MLVPQVRQYPIAQKYFIAARSPREAIDMYIKAGMFDEAFELCAKYMQADEVTCLLHRYHVDLIGIIRRSLKYTFNKRSFWRQSKSIARQRSFM